VRFDLTPEQKLLEQTVREFANAEVKPLAKELDETGQFPRKTFQAELGLTGIAVPEQYGGAGFDHISYAIVIEEISRVCASTGAILAGQNSLYCGPIHRYATEEQKKRLLEPFARGEKIGCFALTEPHAGSNAAASEDLRGTQRRPTRSRCPHWTVDESVSPRRPLAAHGLRKTHRQFPGHPVHARRHRHRNRCGAPANTKSRVEAGHRLAFYDGSGHRQAVCQ
jgi:hypothetical protein